MAVAVKVLTLFLMTAAFNQECVSGAVKIGRKKIKIIHNGKPLQDLVVLNSRLAPHDLDNLKEFIRPKLHEESDAEGTMLQDNGIEDFRPLDLTVDTGDDHSQEYRKQNRASLLSDSDDSDKELSLDDMPEYGQETKADFKGNQEAIDWLLRDPNEFNVKSYQDTSLLGDDLERDHGRPVAHLHLDDLDADGDIDNKQSQFHRKKADGKRQQGQPYVSWDDNDSIDELDTEAAGDSTSLGDYSDGFDHGHGRHSSHSQHDKADESGGIIKQSYYHRRKGGRTREDGLSSLDNNNFAEGNHRDEKYEDNDTHLQPYHRAHGNRKQFSKTGETGQKKDFNRNDDYDDDYAMKSSNVKRIDGKYGQDSIDSEFTDYNDGQNAGYETERDSSLSQNNVNKQVEYQDAKLFKELANFQHFEENEIFDDKNDFDNLDTYSDKMNNTDDYNTSDNANTWDNLDDSDSSDNSDSSDSYESPGKSEDSDGSYNSDNGAKSGNADKYEGTDDEIYSEDKQTEEKQSDEQNGDKTSDDDGEDSKDSDNENSTYDDTDQKRPHNRPVGTGYEPDDEPDIDEGVGNKADSKSTGTKVHDGNHEVKMDKDEETNDHGSDRSKQGSSDDRVRNTDHNKEVKNLESKVSSHEVTNDKSPGHDAINSSTRDQDKENHGGEVQGKVMGTSTALDNIIQDAKNGTDRDHKNNRQLGLEGAKSTTGDVGNIFRNDSVSAKDASTGLGAQMSSPENRIRPLKIRNNAISLAKPMELSSGHATEVQHFKAKEAYKSGEEMSKQEESRVESFQVNRDQNSNTGPDSFMAEPFVRDHYHRQPEQLAQNHRKLRDEFHGKNSRRHHRWHSSLPRIYSLADLNKMENIVSSLRATAASKSLPMKKQHGDVSIKSLYYYPLHPTPQVESDPPETKERTFSEWNDWSTCSVSCGKGTIVRARVCLMAPCQQKDMYQTKACHKPICQDELQMESLDAHNEVRTKHFSPPLVWSASLAKKAQKVANKLARKDFLTLDDLQEPPGESIAQLKYTGGNMVQRAIHNWYNEVNSYSFSYPKINERTRHFVQIIWRPTKELGVATAKSTNGDYTFVVALYHPPIDNKGHVRQNVLRPGSRHDVYSTF